GESSGFLGGHGPTRKRDGWYPICVGSREERGESQHHSPGLSGPAWGFLGQGGFRLCWPGVWLYSSGGSPGGPSRHSMPRPSHCVTGQSDRERLLRQRLVPPVVAP